MKWGQGMGDEPLGRGRARGFQDLPADVPRPLGREEAPRFLLSSSHLHWLLGTLTGRHAEPFSLPGDARPGDARGLARQQHLLLCHCPDHAG